MPELQLCKQVENEIMNIGINQLFLNLLTSSIKSTCPRNTALQQYLSKPSSLRTLFASSPAAVRFLKSSHKWAIGFPQLMHLIGTIIETPYSRHLKSFLIVFISGKSESYLSI